VTAHNSRKGSNSRTESNNRMANTVGMEAFKTRKPVKTS
jgi:hypothetical protein